MWRDRGQTYCSSGGLVVETQKPTVLEALSLGKSKTENTKAEVSEEQQTIPTEEIAPTSEQFNIKKAVDFSKEFVNFLIKLNDFVCLVSN